MGFPIPGQTIYGAWTQAGEGAADLESRLVNYNTKAAGLVGDSVADDRALLNTLVNVTMQPNGGELDVIGVVRIGSAVTIPSNVRLRFVNGAYLAPDGGVTVTMNGMLAPTLRKIFGGGGVVVLSGGSVPEMYFEWWGVQGDGTNETIGILAALTALQASGGTIRGLGKTYRADGQLLIPNDGGATPKQNSMRITGSGASQHAGQTGAMLGGTIFDLRYAGVGVAKIDTRGLGTLEIDHITFKDDGVSSVPFIQTTNTTLKVHHNRFNGNPTKALTTCDQDAIVLGGTSTVIDGSSNAPFQGYGSDIYSNTFSKIRRGVFGRTFANAVNVQRNWFLHDCGSNLAGGAAIEFLGVAGNTCSGNHVAYNDIEVGGYPYGVKLEQAVLCLIEHNGCYDPTGTHLASVRMEANALYNEVIDGFRSDVKPGISDISTGGPHNTFRTSHQSQQSILTEPQVFTHVGTIYKNALNFGPRTEDTAGNDWFQRIVTPVTGEKYYFSYQPAGGGVEDRAYFWRVDVNTTHLRMLGSGTSKIVADGGGGIQIDSSTAATTAVLGGTAPGILGVTKAGMYGTAGVVRAAAIASPTAPSAGYVQAEAASAKTAIDAIRVALTNIGLTL